MNSRRSTRTSTARTTCWPRTRHAAPDARFYFAGSSEMFGEAAVSPQKEDTPFHARSAYGISQGRGL